MATRHPISGRVRPSTIEELSEFVRSCKEPLIFGAGLERSGAPTVFRERSQGFSRNASALSMKGLSTESYVTQIQELSKDAYSGFVRLDMAAFAGLIDYEPKDMVVKVGAANQIDITVLDEGDGTTLTLSEGTLQNALMREGQCLPFAHPVTQFGFELYSNQSGGYVGRGLSLNLPHPTQTQCGSWRDWVIGMTLVLADGSIVKTGSKVVKSVAGFDAHKLMVGARDTLAIVVDVTLRTFPLEKLPKPDIVVGPAWEEPHLNRITLLQWIQRVHTTDYDRAVKACERNMVFADTKSSTIWCWLDNPEQELPRYPGDWVMRTGCGAKNISITDPTQIALMKKAKSIFDPTNKLNPGELGFL